MKKKMVVKRRKLSATTAMALSILLGCAMPVSAEEIAGSGEITGMSSDVVSDTLGETDLQTETGTSDTENAVKQAETSDGTETVTEAETSEEVTKSEGGATAENGAADEASADDEKDKQIVLLRSEDTSDGLSLQFVEESHYVKTTNSISDNTYYEFAVKIHNPNTELTVQYPSVKLTILSPEGESLGTGQVSGKYVVPEDDAVLVGRVYIDEDKVDEANRFDYVVKCFDKVPSYYYDEPLSTDFTFWDVKANQTQYSTEVTGKINSAFHDKEDLKLTALFRKDGEIVAMDKTFVRGVEPETVTEFSLDTEKDLPEYDAIDLSVSAW